MTEYRESPGVGDRLLLIPPLLAGLWLLWTSLAEPFPDLGTWNGKRLLQLWLLLSLALVPLLILSARISIDQALARLGWRASLGFLTVLLLGLISSLRLDHPGYPLADVAMLFLLGLGCLSMAISRMRQGPRFERVALGLLALTGIGVYFFELVAVAAYMSAGSQYSYLESLIRFGHPRLYNHVQTWTLPILALLPVIFPGRRSLRWLTPVLIGMQWQIIITTGARGSILSLVTAMVIVAVLAPRARAGWLKPQLIGLLVGLLLYGAMAGFFKTAQPEQSDFVGSSVGRPLATTSGRTYLWELAIEDAMAHPLLGAGPAMYACDSPYPVASSPHSFPLQIVAEWGIPAFLLLGTIVVLLMLGLLKRLRAMDDATPGGENLTVACLSISILAACIHACVSGIPIAPPSQVAGMLILGWYWGLPGLHGRQGPRAVKPAGIATAVFLAGLLASSGLLGFAYSELKAIQYRTAYAIDYGVAAPRFWWDGRACLYRYRPEASD